MKCNKKIKDLTEISNTKTNTDVLINNLQIINNELSGLFKTFGTENLEDLLLICFGNNIKISSLIPLRSQAHFNTPTPRIYFREFFCFLNTHQIIKIYNKIIIISGNDFMVTLANGNEAKK